VTLMITPVTEKDGIAHRATGAFCKTLLSSCDTNVILFRWMVFGLLERRKMGIGSYRWDGGTA